MLHTATLDSFAGWLVSAVLIALFVRQSKSTRFLRHPRFDGETDVPPVSLLIAPGSALGFRDRLIAAASQRTASAMQTVIAVREGDDATASVIESLRLAHERIEIVRIPENDVVGRLSARATERFQLFASSDVLLQANAVDALVGRMIEGEALNAIALPRPDDGKATDRQLASWAAFLQLTLARENSLDEIIRRGNIAIVDRDSTEEATRPFFIAAADVATTSASSAASALRDLPLAERLLLAIGILALFTAPLVAAILTRQFSFVVATILGIWLRLRIATRTGEPIENALLQPLTAAWAAVSVLTGI